VNELKEAELAEMDAFDFLNSSKNISISTDTSSTSGE
jgi:hypothetical protein